MSGGIAFLNRLPPAERARLLGRLQGADGQRPAEAGPTIARVDRGRPAVASIWQEQMWFLDQLAPGLANYNVPFAFRLDGPLCQRTLAAALEEIWARHDILRSVLADDGVIVQVAEPPGRPVFSFIDLADEPDPEAAARRRAQAAAQAPIGLVRAPLHRTELMRLDRSGRQHALVWVASHAVADGWSVGVLVRELAATYAAIAGGGRPGLLPLPIQFADYAAWQRQRLAGAHLDRLVAYWSRVFTDPPLLQFPFDFPVPESAPMHGATCQFELPPSIDREVSAASKAMGVTPYVTLLSAYKVLLHRYTGQDDIVVGTAAAGRLRAEFEPLIGPFQNTIGLRTSLAGEPTFQELCRRVHKVLLDGLAHQDLPFSSLVETLRPRRHGGRNPLWQTFFLFGSLPGLVSGVRLAPDLTLTCTGIPNQTVKFDFELTIEPRDGGLWGRFDYRTDLLTPDRAVTICEHYQQVLRQALADPATPISCFAAPDRAGTGTPAIHEIAGTRRVAPTGLPGAVLSRDVVDLVRRMWCETLGVASAADDDDFFAAGGHSLLATRLVTRLRTAFGVDLTLRDFLTGCTPAGVAATIGRLRTAHIAGAAQLALLDRVEAMSDAELAAVLGTSATPDPF